MVSHDMIMGSDHCPIILHLDFHFPMKKTPFSFKFEAMWATVDECAEVVSDQWKDAVFRSPQFSFSSKSIRSRKGLCQWSRSRFKKNRGEINVLKERLLMLQNSPNVEFDVEKKLKADIYKRWEQDEIFWYQKVKSESYINFGDRNSAFFHRTASMRRRRNYISRLKNDDNHWVDNEKEVESLILSYFKKLFRSVEVESSFPFLGGIPTVVSDDMNKLLRMPVLDKEIKIATFEIGALKAPGPDGYNGLFFQKYWATIGKDLCTAVKSFFHNGFIRKDWNKTNIILIPKKSQPEFISDLRPISLCNCCYKVISKILALRLKPFMSELINRLLSRVDKFKTSTLLKNAFTR